MNKRQIKRIISDYDILRDVLEQVDNKLCEHEHAYENEEFESLCEKKDELEKMRTIFLNTSEIDYAKAKPLLEDILLKTKSVSHYNILQEI